MYEGEPEQTNDMRQQQEEEERRWEETKEREAFDRWWKHLDMDEDYIRGYDDGAEPPEETEE